jgi:hypothetical protein
MFGWKMLLNMLLPMLEAMGQAKVNEDENDTGKDDIVGQAMLFGVKIFRAIATGDTDKLQKMLPQHALKSPDATSFNPPQDPMQ